MEWLAKVIIEYVILSLSLKEKMEKSICTTYSGVNSIKPHGDDLETLRRETETPIIAVNNSVKSTVTTEYSDSVH